MSGIWKTMLDYVYGELVKGLTDFFTMMNSMGADTLELPWVQAIVLFFSYLGWSLFLAGTAVAIFDCAIEAQNGKPAVRDMSLNLLKGFLAVSLFTVVPVELFKLSVDLQGELGKAICEVFQIGTTDISTLSMEQLQLFTETTMLNLFFVIGMGYCVIKVFFANIKRGGILLINIAVGSMYMLSVPRGYMDGFNGWCKQVAAICLTTMLQTTILTAGLLTCPDHTLMGLGLMLSANEVPRIAERFGMDTSAKVNIMSTYYAINSMAKVVKGIAGLGTP